jgi:hypothetical protein
VEGRRPRSRDLGRRPRWCASPSARHPLRKSQSVSKSQQVVPIVALVPQPTFVPRGAQVPYATGQHVVPVVQLCTADRILDDKGSHNTSFFLPHISMHNMHNNWKVQYFISYRALDSKTRPCTTIAQQCTTCTTLSHIISPVDP